MKAIIFDHAGKIARAIDVAEITPNESSPNVFLLYTFNNDVDKRVWEACCVRSEGRLVTMQCGNIEVTDLYGIGRAVSSAQASTPTIMLQVCGGFLAEFYELAHKHIGAPVRCPFCGGGALSFVNSIGVVTREDPVDASNVGRKESMDEYQCRNGGYSCEGRSFWV